MLTLRKSAIVSLLLMVFLAAQIVCAQPNDRLIFQHLTPDDGLSSFYVQAILQDRQGFLWFGTSDGLNKYDGYTLTMYRHNPDDPNTLSNNNINALSEDRQGFLWVSTANGLNRFDPRTERFVCYRHAEENPHSLSSSRSWTVLEDHTGTLWVATLGGLDKFDRDTETFTHFRHDIRNPHSLSSNQVWTLSEDRQHALWVGTSGGLNRFDPNTGTFTRYQYTADDPGSLSHGDVRAIYEDREGGLWVGTLGGGLNRFDRETGTFTHIRHRPDDPKSLSSDMVSFMYEDATGVFWIGTQGGGLNRFDRDTATAIRYLPDPANPDGISDTGVLSICEDRAGILWIGTSGSGVNILDRRARKFALYRHNAENPDSIGSNHVMAIHEDRQGNIWVGLADNGLDRFNPVNGTFTHYPADPHDPHRLGYPTIFHIAEDHTGMLWISTWGGGLYRFDQKAEQFTGYQYDAGNPYSISHNIVTAMTEDRAQRLWVGTWGGGLNRFDRATGQFTRYQHDETHAESLSDNRILDLYEDHAGTLWVGTVGGGLDRFRPETDAFAHYRHADDDSRSLSNNIVQTLYEDRRGAFWVGTTNGLDRFDRDSGTFTAYLERDGLPNTNILCIQEDTRGDLWLSTNKGLSRFDPRSATFRNYDLSDGLQGAAFDPTACARSQTGALFFGGVNGLNAFIPEQVTDNPYIPPVVLTGLRISNHRVGVGGDSPLHDALPFAKQVTLRPEQSQFDLEFAALNYTHPDRNQYAYRLEGFDTDWIQTDSTQRFARYTNLDPGRYTFRVKASNNDGLWNETGATLDIIVLPAWYETWLFRASLMVAAIALIAGGYRWRVRSLEAHSRELERIVTERTAALHERENRLRTILETSQAGIILVDPHGVITFANQRMADMFKRPLSDVIGSAYPDHLHPAEKQIGGRKMRQLIAGKIDTVSLERHYRCADGSDFWGLLSGRRMLDASGQLVSLVGIITDITERKQAEIALRESEKRFAAVMNSMEAIIYVADMQTYNILFINEYTRKIFGNIEEQTCWKVLQRNQSAPCSFCTSEYLVKNGAPTGIYTWDFQNTVTGRWFHIEDQAIRWIDGRLVRLEVATDITDLKQTEEALRKAKEDADAANRAKSTFLANMSHELRTPLNGILGYAQILQRDQALSAKQQEHAAMILRSGQYLLTLIDDILDLAKVEAGKIELQPAPFDLDGLLHEVSDVIRVRAGQKDVLFHLDRAFALSGAIIGDSHRLRQVLLNLLGNAIKFTERGAVTLRVRHPECQSSSLSSQSQALALQAGQTGQSHALTLLRFEVEDTGVGIAPEDIQKIFEPFHQTGDHAYRRQGAGLGLSISRRLVEIMGGSLHARSALGRGSVFWFDLSFPVAHEQTTLSSHSDRLIAGIKGAAPTILLVDDLPENLNMLTELLEPVGFTVITADNGQEGLRQAMTSHPDAIIADLRMPEMDGLELIRRIRQTSELQDIVVIASSASVYEHDRQNSYEAGSQAFLPKPIDAAHLFEQLRTLLSLDWVYQGENTAIFGDEPLILPSAEELDRLRHTAVIGDMLALQEQLDQFERTSPRFHALVSALRPMVQEFRLDRVQAFLHDCCQCPSADQESSDSTPKELLSEEAILDALAALPPDFFDNLYQVTILCDAHKIEQSIHHIRAVHAALADALSALAEEFNYGRILTLLRTSKNSAGDSRENP